MRTDRVMIKTLALSSMGNNISHNYVLCEFKISLNIVKYFHCYTIFHMFLKCYEELFSIRGYTLQFFSEMFKCVNPDE